MKKNSLCLAAFAVLLPLSSLAQFFGINLPEIGKNCSPDIYQDWTAWSPPGEPPMALHYQWDLSNSSWTPTYQSFYTYQANGLLASHMVADVNGTPLKRLDYTYTANGQVEEAVTLNYGVVTSTWQPELRVLYTYHPDGYMLERLHQSYGFNQWYNELKVNWNYEAFGFVTESMSYGWDDVGQQWVIDLAAKTIFTYLPNGYPNESFEYTHSNGIWIQHGKNKYAYDANNNITGYEISYWDGTAYAVVGQRTDIVWHDFSVKEYDYFQDWQYNGTSFDPYSTFSYNHTDCQGYTLDNETWDGSSFQPSGNSEKIYDDQGVFIRHESVYLDVASGNWIVGINEQGIPTYDGSGAILEYVLQESDSLMNLQNAQRTVFDYSNGIQTSGQIQLLSIHPNPSAGSVSLNIPKGTSGSLLIFDSKGQLIHQENTSPNSTNAYDLKELANGYYLVEFIAQSGNIYRSPLIIEH